MTKIATGVSVSMTGELVVAHAALTAYNGLIPGTAGSPTPNVPAAVFTDADPTELASAFAAQINWGDGTSSTTTNITGSAGLFSVMGGGHTYAVTGLYQLVVVVLGPAGPVPADTVGLMPGEAQVNPGNNPTISGPSVVPGNSQYTFNIDLTNLGVGDVDWDVQNWDQTAASNNASKRVVSQYGAPTTSSSALIEFSNVADKVKVRFLGWRGKKQGAPLYEVRYEVAIVQVKISDPTPDGKPFKSLTGLLGPHDDPDDTDTFVTRDNASVITRLVPLGYQPWDFNQYWRLSKRKWSPADQETAKVINTKNTGTGRGAFQAYARVELVSPDGWADAYKRIVVGYIQTAKATGSAQYAGGKERVFNYAKEIAPSSYRPVDWLALKFDAQGNPVRDAQGGRVPDVGVEWPWAGKERRWVPRDEKDPPTKHVFEFDDPPTFLVPAKWKLGSDNALQKAQPVGKTDFILSIAAMTLDSSNDASDAHFNESSVEWQVNWWWPARGTSVKLPSEKTWPNAPLKDIPTDVVPAVVSFSVPFGTWDPK